MLKFVLPTKELNKGKILMYFSLNDGNTLFLALSAIVRVDMVRAADSHSS